jgi:hypothetical protein
VLWGWLGLRRYDSRRPSIDRLARSLERARCCHEGPLVTLPRERTLLSLVAALTECCRRHCSTHRTPAGCLACSHTPKHEPTSTHDQNRTGRGKQATNNSESATTRDFLGDQFLDLPLHDVISLTRAVADVSVCISTKKTTTTNSEQRKPNKPTAKRRKDRAGCTETTSLHQATNKPNTTPLLPTPHPTHTHDIHIHFIQTLRRIHTYTHVVNVVVPCSVVHSHTHTLAQLPAPTSDTAVVTQNISLLCVLVAAVVQFPPHSPCKDDSPDR